MAYIKLNRENFYYNLRQIVHKTGSMEKIAIVLKDNAYGHGLVEMATMASDFGIKYAVVRDEGEARQIASFFDNTLILGGVVTPLAKCSYAINALESIAYIPPNTQVELKIDTGMHRNGILSAQLEQALEAIKTQQLDLRAVMTHYRSADELSSEYFWQQKEFISIKHKLQKLGFDNLKYHSANSAAVLRSNCFDEDFARIGIGAYGYNELESTFDKLTLKPVLSLHAKKISTRVLKKGQRVGYGGRYQAPKDMKISTYNLGYGDGWCRGDSSHPFITAEGLPILGRVSMDMMSLESANDEVCIFNDAQNAATQLGTISYEITTSLSPSIKRVIV